MDRKELYEEFLSSVEKKLDEYVQIIEPKNIYEPFRYIVSGGGKRIRPVLTMLSTGAVGGDPYHALNAGVAIEIMHNFTLVHDDIMDDSPLRRGRQTIHEKWDEPSAILTGDLMIGYAYRLLPRLEDPAKYAQMQDEFTRALIEVTEGQAYDMFFQDKDDVTIDDYFLMIEKKTARLLESAAVIGAILGGADDKTIETMREFARAMGIAFQLQDDLLDLTADQEKLGKKIGQDIIEGKKTYMILLAKERSVLETDIDLLDKFYAEKGLPEKYVPAITEMFQRLGIIETAVHKVSDFSELAKQKLENIEQNIYTDSLLHLVDSLNKRKS